MSASGPGRMWVINSEHRLLLDAITRHDTTDAERTSAGTSVELASSWQSTRRSPATHSSEGFISRHHHHWTAMYFDSG